MKTSKTLILLVSLMITGIAKAEDTNKIVNTVSEKKVVLSDDVKEALKKWNAKFTLYSVDDYPAAVVDMFKDDKDQLPMATFGDFTGDGKSEDLALLGHDDKSDYAVFVLKKKSGYDVLKMYEADYTSPHELHISSPQGSQVGLGTYLALVKHKDFKLKNKPSKTIEALQVEEYRGPAHQFFVRDGKVVENK